jgi:hypothetical protein
MVHEYFDPTIYDDPNCLLGSSEADLEITKYKNRWHLDFAGDRYSICSNCLGSDTSLTITSYEPSEGAINWALSKDPLQWHFEPNYRAATSSLEPNNWGRLDFIRVLSTWPAEHVTHPLLSSVVRGHYKGLALWLLFREVKGSEKKKKLRSLLWTTPLLQLKPHADFCAAKREFANQIFPKSGLAQRAGDEELLWLAMEYSTCLQKDQLDWEHKTPWREFCTQSIRTCRQALHKNDFGEILTVEQLQSEGKDWREHITSILLQDAIRLTFEYEDEDLKHHCLQFLNAWERYVGTVGHQKTQQIYYQDSNGDLRATCKGYRKGKKVTPLMLASRLLENY